MTHNSWEEDIGPILNRKLSNQCVGPFQIIHKVGELAYKLKLPPTMRIHPVVSISQLEPAPQGKDPYERSVDIELPPVTNEDDDAPSYKIERLMNKWVTRERTQYLVKWKGYHHGHDAWYDLDDLQEASELVKKYNQLHPVQVKRHRRRGR